MGESPNPTIASGGETVYVYHVPEIISPISYSISSKNIKPYFSVKTSTRSRSS